jgi:hypothetical protein
MRCSICVLSTNSKILIEEPRYFIMKRNVCTRCFDLWVDAKYDKLDELAMEKIK